MAVIVMYGRFGGRRQDHAKVTVALALSFLLALCKVTQMYQDDGQQITAYCSGIFCWMDCDLFDLANESY